jgi:hypothetical protein
MAHDHGAHEHSHADDASGAAPPDGSSMTGTPPEDIPQILLAVDSPGWYHQLADGEFFHAPP